MEVAPITAALQDHITNASNSDELLSVFSKSHLQRLHSSFTSGSNRTEYKGRTDRPLWNSIEVAIREGSSVVEPKKPPKDLSGTISEHLTQLATSVKGIWSGNIYKKSLDHLLRTLLRVHLAPHREERCKVQARAKENPREQGQGTGTTTKLTTAGWRRQVLLLCDDLCDNTMNNRGREHIVLHKLIALSQTRPTPKQSRFEKIESELVKSKERTQVVVQSGSTNRSEDEDEDEDGEEDEDDGDKDNGGSNNEKDIPGEYYKNSKSNARRNELFTLNSLFCHNQQCISSQTQGVKSNMPNPFGISAY